MNAVMCLRVLLTRQQIVEKYQVPDSAADDFFSRVEPSVGSGDTARYFEPDVDAQIDGGRLLHRPQGEHFKSSSMTEDLEMVSMEKGSLDRIVNGLERLIEALVPKAPPPVIQMMTPLEASKRMRLHVQTVMKWCRQRKMGTKCGSRWLISPDEVNRYLRGRLMTTGQQVAP